MIMQNGFTNEYEDLMRTLLVRAGFVTAETSEGLSIEPLNGIEDEQLLQKMRNFNLI